MSSTCSTYVQSNFCTSQCSPNIYAFNTKTANRPQIPACQTFCQSFLAACQNDYICFNPDGLAEYLQDMYNNGQVTEGKDYLMTRCTGNYDCKKISESIIANEPGQFILIKKKQFIGCEHLKLRSLTLAGKATN